MSYKKDAQAYNAYEEQSREKLAVINLMKAYLDQHMAFLGYVLREKKKK